MKISLLIKIIFLLLIVMGALFIFPNKVWAVKCGFWIECDFSETTFSFSGANLELTVKGSTENGLCRQSCYLPDLEGVRAIADPVEKFQYRFNNTGDWIDFEKGVDWRLDYSAFPTSCTGIAPFTAIYSSFVYLLDATIDVSGLSSGTYRIYYRAYYEIGKTVEFSGSSFTIEEPEPTLFCSLSSNPSSGTAPLNDVDLIADVSGTATGDIIYKFDCTDSIIWNHTSLATSDDPYTAANLCDYSSEGNYTIKAEVTREGITATCQNTVTIEEPTGPVCGDGKIEGDEECESDSDCDDDYWTNDYRCSGNTLQRKRIYEYCNVCFGCDCYCYGRNNWYNVENCDDDDNWYNHLGTYNCCEPGTENLCTCQNQWYQDYSCVVDACTYEVTNVKTTYSSCGYDESCAGNELPNGFHDADSGTQNETFCRAAGWTTDPDDTSTDVSVRIFSDDVQIATTTASSYRGDLGAVCSGGTCAYGVNIYDLITHDTNHEIKVQAQDINTGSWVDLSNTPKTLNCIESCECSSGDCCSNGCDYDDSSTVCGSETGFQCSGSDCGNDYQSRDRDKYCSGSSSSCDGSYGSWSGWSTIENCTDLEKCFVSGDHCQYDVICEPSPIPTVDLSGPSEVNYNTTADLSWTSTNANSCEASADWDGGRSTSGIEETSSLIEKSTFILTCTGAGGLASDSVAVNIIGGPSVDIKADGSDGPIEIGYNTSTGLSWTSNLDSCEASGDWSGIKDTLGNWITGNLISNSVFTLTCATGGDSASDSVAVNIANALPLTSCDDEETWVYCTDSRNPWLSWSYSDADGDAYESYQLQADNNSSFASPELDTGVINISSLTYHPSGENFNFNTLYYWRVKVKDDREAWSNWCSPVCSFTTPAHAYPDPDFTWVPQSVSVDEPIQFIDQTNFYNGNHSWEWTFEDPGMVVSNRFDQNPLASFSSAGSWEVTLDATDDIGTCDISKTINVNIPLPEWREVKPK